MKKNLVTIVIRQNGSGEYIINGKVSIKVIDGDLILKMDDKTTCYEESKQKKYNNRKPNV